MRILLALIALAAPACAVAANLDAPLKPAPPTLGSEIRRGADAAFACRLRRADPLDGEALLACLDRAQGANRQSMGRGYEAFDAGLWLIARDAFDELARVAPSDLARSEAAVAAVGLREAERVAGVTDEDVRVAIRTRR